MNSPRDFWMLKAVTYEDHIRNIRKLDKMCGKGDRVLVFDRNSHLRTMVMRDLMEIQMLSFLSVRQGKGILAGGAEIIFTGHDDRLRGMSVVAASIGINVTERDMRLICVCIIPKVEDKANA